MVHRVQCRLEKEARELTSRQAAEAKARLEEVRRPLCRVVLGTKIWRTLPGFRRSVFGILCAVSVESFLEISRSAGRSLRAAAVLDILAQLISSDLGAI